MFDLFGGNDLYSNLISMMLLKSLLGGNSCSKSCQNDKSNGVSANSMPAQSLAGYYNGIAATGIPSYYNNATPAGAPMSNLANYCGNATPATNSSVPPQNFSYNIAVPNGGVPNLTGYYGSVPNTNVSAAPMQNPIGNSHITSNPFSGGCTNGCCGSCGTTNNP